MAQLKETDDFGYIFVNYSVIYHELPVIDDLVYVSCIGIFNVDNVYNNGDIDVKYNDGKVVRLPTSYYRLIKRKGGS
ncbi:hypothetical protein ACSVDA_02310 [Cytobacillus sp. Hm23]